MKRKERDGRRKRDYGTEQQLPQVLVEEILERLGIKSLVRFTSVSKQWNSMIKSTSFVSRHLIRAQSQNPHILIGRKRPESSFFEAKPYSYLETLELGSSESKEIHIIPKPKRSCSITGSCDGLVCVYDDVRFIYLINPATRWFRSLPRAKIQRVNRARLHLDSDCELGSNQLGLGKDIVTGKYKMVWLYNSFERGLYSHTTCEVFDFNTNTWRHVIVSKHFIHPPSPVYLDGSLHWLTHHRVNGETQILHLDLHNEVFQVMAETPVVQAYPYPDNIGICSLNNHLCLTVRRSIIHEIWLLNSYRVWEKTYSVDLNTKFLLIPVTLFNKAKTELLFLYVTRYPCLVVHNTIIGSYSTYPGSFDLDHAISYIPSLISI